MTVALFAIVAAALLGGAFSLKAAEMRRLRGELVSYRLQFPAQLDQSAVGRFFSGLSGLLLPWWRRWLLTPFVVVEAEATTAGIGHRLRVPRGWAVTVENLLQAHLPGVRYSAVDGDSGEPVAIAAEYRLSTGRRSLRVDSSAMSARMLASLQPLRPGERLVVHWTLAAASPVSPAVAAPGGQRALLSFLRPKAELTPEEASALRDKQSHPLLLGVCRIGAAAASVGRARALVRQVEGSLHATRAPGVQLRRRGFGEVRAAARLNNQVVPLVVWPGIFNSEELIGLVSWPIATQQIAGLVLGGCRPLAPSPVLPRVGTVVGEANFPGSERPIALDVQARRRNLWCVGPTGTGKSTLAAHLIEQDLEAGFGVVVIDPKGDLISSVLARMPRHRERVIVLDPADAGVERPVGLNPLRSATGPQAEVQVENLVGLLHALWRSSWGPRTDDILRAALLSLASTGGATLCEVPLLLTDAAYRRRIVSGLDDPVGLGSFWHWYEHLSPAEQLAVVGPPLNKIRAFTMRPRVRAIVGQVEPRLDLKKVLAEQQVLLVSLASGLLGEEAAALLGALVVAELWHATTARAGIPPEQRRPVMAHLDEFQHFLHLPTPMPTVLAEARGLGLGLNLLHQNLGQLPRDVLDALMSNARSKIVFQLSSDDARVMARQLGGGLTPEDLQGLGAYEIVAQLFAAGHTQPAATARALPPDPPYSDPEAIRRQSRERYGVDRDEVESAIRARHRSPTAEAPVGRRRRGSGGAA